MSETIFAGVAFAAFIVWLTVRIVNRPERWIKQTAAAIPVIARAAYVAAYAWMVRPGMMLLTIHGREIPSTYPIPPVYCGNGPFHDADMRNQEIWKQLFAPIHGFDRKMRPETWTWHKPP